VTLAGIYVDQPEEMPEDFFAALQARLSQPGYPHQWASVCALMFGPGTRRKPAPTEPSERTYPIDSLSWMSM
jgi:hypothetical protein